MLFQSLTFFLCFAAVFALYWGLRSNRLRMLVLLAASCAFYMSWGPWFIIVVAVSTTVDFVAARRIEAAPTQRRRRAWLTLAIAVNLVLLASFKYSGFLADQVCGALNLAGFGLEPPRFTLLMPLGISFYTFEAISYVVDVYHGRIRAERNPLHYALFIMFFPHLISGPIIRAGEFLPQVRRTKVFNPIRLVVGAQFLVIGLFKKIVIADRLALVVDPVFADPAKYGTGALWIAWLSYAVQVYCDFSGYSDMAIGLAHAFGFRLPANFRMPYFAPNIAEFWQRWHISLSNWLRDYLYIPLGGNRHGRVRTALNLALVMFLGGLWHGPNWTFAAWGLYQGLLLAVHRVAPFPATRLLRPLTALATFSAFSLGWVLFRAASFADARTVFGRMFRRTGGAAIDDNLQQVAAELIALVFVCHFVGTYFDLPSIERRLPGWVMGIGLAGLFLLTQLLAAPEGKPFIYFQF